MNIKPVTIVSDTIQEFCGYHFWRCGHYFQRHGMRLHRAVWEEHHGPIPPGYHVHHKDGNRDNNQIDNLECMPPEQHQSAHWKTDYAAKRKDALANLAKGRESAKEWHRSEEGREWHRQHVEESLGKARKKLGEEVRKCGYCGKEFVPKSHHMKFCGNNCKCAWRRESGADMEERECAVCGTPFTVNRYWKTQTCSRSCAGKL